MKKMKNQLKSNRTETSSPLSFSSTTIVLPAAPYFLSPKMLSTAAHASFTSLATTTPLPAANPLALTTKASYVALIGKNHMRTRYFIIYELIFIDRHKMFF